MSCGVTPKHDLPRLYFVCAGVSSPFTSRYPKHTVGASHHEPAAASACTAGPASPNSRTAPAPSATLEALRRRLEDNDAFIARMLFRLRDFPDAAAAISEMLKPTGPPGSHPPDSFYE